jgi:DNA-binding MarR family transcriptional regulator
MALNRQEKKRMERMDRLMWMMREVSEGMTRLSHEYAEASGLHITDVAALSFLSRHTVEEPMTIGSLREHLGLSPAAMTKLVDRLEVSGHVRRAPDSHDRRRIQLEVTEKANDLAKDVFSRFMEHTQITLDSYDDENLEVAERFLSDIRDALPGPSKEK